MTSDAPMAIDLYRTTLQHVGSLIGSVGTPVWYWYKSVVLPRASVKVVLAVAPCGGTVVTKFPP